MAPLVLADVLGNALGEAAAAHRIRRRGHGVALSQWACRPGGTAVLVGLRQPVCSGAVRRTVSGSGSTLVVKALPENCWAMLRLPSGPVSRAASRSGAGEAQLQPSGDRCTHLLHAAGDEAAQVQRLLVVVGERVDEVQHQASDAVAVHRLDGRPGPGRGSDLGVVDDPATGPVADFFTQPLCVVDTQVLGDASVAGGAFSPQVVGGDPICGDRPILSAQIIP